MGQLYRYLTRVEGYVLFLSFFLSFSFSFNFALSYNTRILHMLVWLRNNVQNRSLPKV